jgi:hypothetical protein
MVELKSRKASRKTEMLPSGTLPFSVGWENMWFFTLAGDPGPLTRDWLKPFEVRQGLFLTIPLLHKGVSYHRWFS